MARAHDIVQRGPGQLQRLLDALQTAPRLRRNIADDLALVIDAGHTGHHHVAPDADRTREAEGSCACLPNGLPRDVLPGHLRSSSVRREFLCVRKDEPGSYPTWRCAVVTSAVKILAMH